MTGALPWILAVLALWLLVCGYAGFSRRFIFFLCTLIVGLGLNFLWMYLALEAHPLERHALIAQASLSVYGLCALGVGFLSGRIYRRWSEGEVDSHQE